MLMGQKYGVHRTDVLTVVRRACGTDLSRPVSEAELLAALQVLERIKVAGLGIGDDGGSEADAVARRDIEACMRLIVSRRGSAYRAARRIWGTAIRHATASSTTMGPLWLIWGALTDWVERRPAEAEQAKEAMGRAAREWLSLPETADAHRAYFDRWLYKELEYARPQHNDPGRNAGGGQTRAV